MSNEVKKQQGIDLEQVRIDANGEIDGLDDDVLDAIAGGVMAKPTNDNCGQTNVTCKW